MVRTKAKQKANSHLIYSPYPTKPNQTQTKSKPNPIKATKPNQIKATKPNPTNTKLTQIKVTKNKPNPNQSDQTKPNQNQTKPNQSDQTTAKRANQSKTKPRPNQDQTKPTKPHQTTYSPAFFFWAPGSWLSEPDPTQPSEPGRRLGGKRPAEGGAQTNMLRASEGLEGSGLRALSKEVLGLL